MPAGHPSLPIDANLFSEICERLACSDKALYEVLADLDSPISERTFYRWKDSTDEMRQEYLRAREDQGLHVADKAMVESRTCRIGQIVKDGPKGTDTTTADNVERSKLIVNAYFKRAGQLNKALGEKIQQDVNLTGELQIAERLATARQRK